MKSPPRSTKAQRINTFYSPPLRLCTIFITSSLITFQTQMRLRVSVVNRFHYFAENLYTVDSLYVCPGFSTVLGKLG
jgi:hypothetical protein